MGHSVTASHTRNMRGLSLACVLLLAGSVFSQETTESSSSEDVAVTTISSASTTNVATSTTEAPVVIVKQVNEINEDGTYTVGYEASDGSFKLETKDADGNVKGKYGVVDENGDIKIVEYSANNSTGFTSDLELPEVQAVELETPVQQADPAFELEKQRHEAVLAFQKAVIEKQQRIAAQNDASAQRQAFANNRQQQGARRPVFNAANFNPSRPASEQFNTQNFNADFRDFQQQQQFRQQQQPCSLPSSSLVNSSSSSSRISNLPRILSSLLPSSSSLLLSSSLLSSGLSSLLPNSSLSRFP